MNDITLTLSKDTLQFYLSQIQTHQPTVALVPLLNAILEGIADGAIK